MIEGVFRTKKKRIISHDKKGRYCEMEKSILL